MPQTITTGTYGSKSLRGHMALNSSPLKPCVNKLSSQYMIQDHMTSHYYNLATIKSAIDTKAPKSTSLSIKKQDQIRREAALKQIRSTGSFREATSKLKHNKQRSPYYSEDGISQFNGNVVLSRPLTASSSWSPNRYNAAPLQPRPATADTFTTHKSNTTTKLSPRSNGVKKDVLNLTYSGDYLNRHQDRFHNSDGSLFTPRTKKRPGKSFLSQSKHYAPPVRASKKKDSERKPGSSGSYKKLTQEDVRNISELDRETNHRKWIEEQSEFVEKLSEIERKERQYATQLSGSGPSSARSSARKMIDLEEEELKYLKFVNEVTEDILSTGVYSDSVLHQLMERHVDRKKNELSVRKMWEMLDKLKIDLGMSDKRHRNAADRKPMLQAPLHSGYNEGHAEEPRAMPRKTALEKHVHIRPDPEDIKLDSTTSTFATLTSAGVTRDDDYKEINKEFSPGKIFVKEPLEFHSTDFKGVPESQNLPKNEKLKDDADASVVASSVVSNRSSHSRAEKTSGQNIAEAPLKKIRDRSDDIQIKSNSLTSFKSRTSSGESVKDLHLDSNDVFHDEISQNSGLNFEKKGIFSPVSLEKSSSKRSLFSTPSEADATLQRNFVEREESASKPIPKRRFNAAEPKSKEEFEFSVQPVSSSAIDVKTESIETEKSKSSLKQKAIKSSHESVNDHMSNHNGSRQHDDVEFRNYMISRDDLETHDHVINFDRVPVDNHLSTHDYAISQSSMSDGRRDAAEEEEGGFSSFLDEIRDAALKASGSDLGSEAGTEATYTSVPALSMTLKPPKSPEQSELGFTGARGSTNNCSDVAKEDKPAASSLLNAQEDTIKYSDDFESDDDAF